MCPSSVYTITVNPHVSINTMRFLASFWVYELVCTCFMVWTALCTLDMAWLSRSCNWMLFQTSSSIIASMWLLKRGSYRQGFCLTNSISSSRQVSEIVARLGIMKFVKLVPGSSMYFLELCTIENPLNIDHVFVVYASINWILPDLIATWSNLGIVDTFRWPGLFSLARCFSRMTYTWRHSLRVIPSLNTD